MIGHVDPRENVPEEKQCTRRSLQDTSRILPKVPQGLLGQDLARGENNVFEITLDRSHKLRRPVLFLPHLRSSGICDICIVFIVYVAVTP